MSKETIKYNSPKNAKNPYIFSKVSLIYLIDTWNKYKTNKIIYKKTDKISKLSELLNEKIKPICDDKQYWCWTGTISKIATNAKTKELIKMIEKEELRPEMPIEWYKNKTEWLSNYDIEDVMNQYEEVYPHFKFYGTNPIDFAAPDPYDSTALEKNKCLQDEICKLNLKELSSNILLLVVVNPVIGCILNLLSYLYLLNLSEVFVYNPLFISIVSPEMFITSPLSIPVKPTSHSSVKVLQFSKSKLSGFQTFSETITSVSKSPQLTHIVVLSLLKSNFNGILLPSSSAITNCEKITSSS